MDSNPFLGHEHRRPAVEADEALVFLEQAFGRTGILHELGSHQDRNFRVDTPDGERFVLKVARQGISHSELDAENEAMLLAGAAGLPFDVPVPQAALDGALVVRATTASGEQHDLRLLTYLDGEPLDGISYLAPAVLQAHGTMAARMSLALEGWDHPALDRELQWDLRFAAHVVEAGALQLHAGTEGVCRAGDRLCGRRPGAACARPPDPRDPCGRDGPQHGGP
jgi:Ser/Thr protein kinase RdoA (MazF antagonist)